MSEKDSYQKLIDHHKKWIFGSPGPELLRELFETIFTLEEAEFLSKIPFILLHPIYNRIYYMLCHNSCLIKPIIYLRN